ncbi:Retrovirus-related Pol polyprotein from transposon TNT 1-94 Includes: RecName: Full=Protease; Includes: RecName: Full=Reverse transcriptase; Includes: RecName: Full=Endonuclease [Serendipita indica DSM 11827]|nr:Retrovirus-related Pol polyprotein from transposon TNT 1-94 Includes: RecName: Full=Protease; Includes: RecName: Full=Reverse transcriptase; Includes: RecName: Full=Endonuclease [Serendipita indica DSM 11827]
MRVPVLDGKFALSTHENALAATSSSAPLAVWHNRLGHRSYDALAKLNLPLSDRIVPRTCIPCINGKLTRAPSTQLARRATRPLERIFSDVHGPMRVQGRHQERYWVTFQDDYSRFVVLYCVKSKSDVFRCFKEFVAWSTNQMNTRRISFDENDMRTVFDEFCAALGIQREHTIRDTPQQNGPVERFNRTLSEGVAALLNQSRLPASTWVDAASAFVHVHNRMPSSSTDGKSPFELFNGEAPSLDRMRTFGCEAWVHLQRDQRSPSLDHAVRAVFLGYPPTYSGWRFVNLSTGKEVISNSAVFVEDVFPGRLRADAKGVDYTFTPGMLDSDDSPPSSPHPAPAPASIPPAPPPLSPTLPTSPSPTAEPVVPATVNTGGPSLVFAPGNRVEILLPPPNLGTSQPTAPPPPLSREEKSLKRDYETHPGNHLSRSERQSRAKVNYAESSDDETADCAFSTGVIDNHDWIPFQGAMDYVFAVTESLDPRSWKEAMSRPDANKWIKAAHEELEALLKNGTWQVVRLPQGKTVLGNKWVFKTKKDATGNVERHKVRLVAKGFLQKQGVDFDETFAPTGSLAALRTVIATATELDWEIHSIDISSAFLNGDMDAEVYMELPEGVKIPLGELDGLEEGSVKWALRLLKALYGLKQAGRRWSVKLHQALTKLGFVRTVLEPSCYLYEKEGIKLVVPVYVDDLTCACASQVLIRWFKDALKKEFDLRYMKETKFVLGIAVDRDRKLGKTFLSQTSYIKEISYAFFGTRNVHPLSTPIAPGLKLTNEDAPQTPNTADVKRIQEYTGKLLYLQRATRPDIAFALHQICRFTQNPGRVVMEALNGLMRYVHGSMHLRLTYTRSGKNEPQAFETFSDSDHGGDPVTHRSTGGFAVMMCSGAVNWGSKLHKTVSLSSTEAEYITASIVGCDIMWQRGFLEELGFPSTGPSPIYLDSNSAAQVVRNPEHQSTMKQVNRRYHWIRERVAEGDIEVRRVAGSDNPADIFTKPLNRIKFLEFRSMLGLQ